MEASTRGHGVLAFIIGDFAENEVEALKTAVARGGGAASFITPAAARETLDRATRLGADPSALATLRELVDP